MKTPLALFTTILVNALALPAAAQYYTGFSVGADLTGVKATTDATWHAETSPAIGIIIGRRLPNNLAIQLEPLYFRDKLMQGPASLPGDANSINYERSRIEVHLSLRKTLSNSNLKPYFLLGPVAIFEGHTQGQASFGNFTIATKNNDFEFANFALSAGAGFAIDIGRFSIFTTGRYLWNAFESSDPAGALMTIISPEPEIAFSANPGLADSDGFRIEGGIQLLIGSTGSQ